MTSIIYTVVYFLCLCSLSFYLCYIPSLFLENPCNRNPLGIFRNCFKCSLDSAVGLIQVVVDDAQVEIVTVGRLDFSALIARPLQLFILNRKCDFATSKDYYVLSTCA